MSDLPPIWVINLDRARERREFVERVFAEADLPYERFPAVDGRALTEADLAAYSSRRAHYEYGRDIGRGMLGCSLSHLRVLEKMVAEGLDEVAVFEDDVRPSPELGVVLRARALLPADWEVVTLHALFPWAGPVHVGRDPLVAAYWIARFDRTPMGTQGYLIRRAAAERVLAVGYPVALPPDELLFRSRPVGLRVYGIDPSPLVHEEGELGSEIRVELPPIAMHGPVARLGLGAAQIAGKVRRRITPEWRQRGRLTSASTSAHRPATTDSS